MTSAIWKTIGELVADGSILAIQDGNHGGSHPKASEYVPEGIPFVMASNIADGRLDLEGCKRLPKERTDRLRIGFAMPGDVLLTHKGTVGEVAIVPKVAEYVMLTPQVTYYRVNADRLDPRFLALAFRSRDFQSQLVNISAQSTRPYVAITTQRHLRIQLPPLETQRRIAGILGAYDDLIEVNRRRIAVLEEMARGLFTEWFIRLRFPGHEGVAIEDTPDGPLPAGWSWGDASDLLLFDPRTRVPREGEKPFIPMGHLDTVTSLIAEPEARTGNSGAKFQNGDTLFARITPCLENGKTGLVRHLPGPDGVGFGSTEFIVMRGGRAGPAFSYCLSRLPAFRKHARMSMSGASGRQRARTDSVANFPIAVPPTNDLFEWFEKAAWPMLELVGQIGLSSERLAAARDLLLPRLISGQLSVVQAERELEAA